MLGPLTAGDFNSTKPSSGLHSAATKLPLARSGLGASRSTRAVPGPRPPGPGPGPSHKRSTRSSASSCHSSWRHRRSRSAWASEPSGRKSLGPCDRWGSFWDRERAARSSAALGRAGDKRSAPRLPRAARAPRQPPHTPSPRRGAPEHTPRGNLHGREFGVRLHRAAGCGCARTAQAPPSRGRDVRAVLAPGAPLPSARPPSGFTPSYLPCVPQTPVCTRVPRSAGPSLICRFPDVQKHTYSVCSAPGGTSLY